MDYRNADGSVAEMCGNGIRLFVRYLVDEGLADGSAPIRGRHPRRRQDAHRRRRPDHRRHGHARRCSATPRSGSAASPGRPATSTWATPTRSPSCPPSTRPAGCSTRPTHDPAIYPDGVNVEFVVRRGDRHVAMRVHERGSGETRSCGTGACAVMVAAAVADDNRPGRRRTSPTASTCPAARSPSPGPPTTGCCSPAPRSSWRGARPTSDSPTSDDQHHGDHEHHQQRPRPGQHQHVLDAVPRRLRDHDGVVDVPRAPPGGDPERELGGDAGRGEVLQPGGRRRATAARPCRGPAAGRSSARHRRRPGSRCGRRSRRRTGRPRVTIRTRIPLSHASTTATSMPAVSGGRGDPSRSWTYLASGHSARAS